MKPYLVTYKFYYNDKLEMFRSTTCLLEEPDEKEWSGTDFDGLWDLKKNHLSMIPYEMIESKKGKRALWHYDKLFARITPKNCKPWKFTITCLEINIRMNELMNFNTEDVIQYLKERGVTACPILK